MTMRRAKIVCTLGPAVESPEKVRELIAAGMNMARLNLSHGGYEEHQNRLDQVRAAAAEAGVPIAILVDLQGPKIRLARFKDGPHDLSRGDVFTITTDDIEGTKERVGTTYKGLPGDCKAGDRILIDDGKVTVEVTAVKGNDVITKVIEPGAVSNNKVLQSLYQLFLKKIWMIYVGALKQARILLLFHLCVALMTSRMFTASWMKKEFAFQSLQRSKNHKL
jgi:pyruvate kinase